MSEIAPEFKPVDTEPIKTVTGAVTLKRAYTMSDSKREQLARARARALELRNNLNAIKPPKVKPVKVKPPSKLEIEISEIQANKPAEPEPEPVEPEVTAEPVEPEVVPKTKQKKQRNPPPIKQQPPPLTFSFPVPPSKEPTVQPLVPPPVGFQRNSFGFFVL